MRKLESLAFSAASALTLFLTASCQKEIVQTSEVSAPYTVEFSMSEMATKTALGEKENNKYPTVWSSDDDERITFYQNGKASTDVDIHTSDEYKYASFTATFSEEGTTPLTYKSLLAGKRADGDKSLPVVPAEQHPTATSFDPDANVLVGLVSEFASKPEKVDLVYKHAAVISRITFTGIPDGLKISSVLINAEDAIAGAAESVDYTDGTVDFSNASEKTVSLIYDVAPEYSGGRFDAYFVAIPGTDVQIRDISLVTDKGTFVKKNSKNSKTSFDVNTLKSITVNNPSSTRTYTKVTSFTSGKKYVIVYDGKALQNNDGTPAAYSVTASGSTITVPADVASSLEWTAKSESDYTISGHFSLSNSGKFAARTDDTKNGFEFQTSVVQKAVWDLDADGNDLYHKNSGGKYTFYLTYNSSTWTVSTQQASNKIAVYAEDGGSTPDIPDVPDTPDTPGEEKVYTKVTAKPDPLDWSGTYLIVDESSKNIFAYDQTGYKKGVTIENNKIVSSELEKYEVTISPATGTDASHYDVKTSDGKYLYRSDSDTGNFLNESYTSASNNKNYYAKIGEEENMISLGTKRSSGTEYFFYYNSTSKAFEFKNDKSKTIQLYKLDGSDEPADTPGQLTQLAVWTVSGVAYSNGDFSGLTFSADGKKIIAAFNSAALYWLDMPVEGNSLVFTPFEVSNASFRTTKRDIEAVTVNGSTGDIYYVQETDATGFSGRTLYKLAAPKYDTEEKIFTFGTDIIPSGNNGAEGLAWIGDDNFIIGREGNNDSISPLMIFYSCSKGVTKTITPASEIKQIAEIVYDDDLDCLWILDGDHDKILYRCDMEGNVLERFSISQIKNAEALLLDKENDCIWIGSDETPSKLYKFSFQQP